MKFVQVLTTIDNEEKAQAIAKILLEKRVIGCAQIFPIASKYWWKGKIEDANEWMVLMKGKDFDAIQREIKQIHSYETPEILALPITNGNKEYLEWLEKEVK